MRAPRALAVSSRSIQTGTRFSSISTCEQDGQSPSTCEHERDHPLVPAASIVFIVAVALTVSGFVPATQAEQTAATSERERDARDKGGPAIFRFDTLRHTDGAEFDSRSEGGPRRISRVALIGG